MIDKIDYYQNNPNFDFKSKLNSDNDNELLDMMDPYGGINMVCQYTNLTDIKANFQSIKGLKLLSWNIYSLNSRYNQLLEFIELLNADKCYLDIIAMQEIWKVYDSECFPITNYNFVWTSRPNRTGGGVGFYIHKDIKFKKINELSLYEDGVIEALTLELEISKQKFMITNVYRPNSKLVNLTQNEQLDRFLEGFSTLQANLASLNNKAYIVGDFNLDLLKFDTHSKTNDLLENSFANGFLQLVMKPTRVNKSSATLIDHIYTNSTSNSYHTSIIIDDTSDHFPLFHTISIDKKKSRQNHFYARKFGDENMCDFKRVLSLANWDNVLQSNNVQESFDMFLNTFNDLFEEKFPLQKIKVNRNVHSLQPFMTTGLLKSRKHKLKLAEEKIRRPTAENLDKYKRYRDLYNKTVRGAKQMHFNTQLETNKHDLRKTWQILKNAMRKCNDKTSIIEEIVDENIVYKDPTDISSKFNNFFVNVAENITSGINVSDKSYTGYAEDSNCSFSFSEIRPNDILKLVKDMPNKSSTDSFGISNNFIKKIIYIIIQPLCHIFNLSLQTGEIPSQLKIAKVTPIFKLNSRNSDDLLQMNNYRPISLLPIFSKILEKIAAGNLQKYLTENALIYRHQYGFQRNKSTLHPLIHFINRIAKADNEKQVSIAVFCDLQKAFDCCSHSILLGKMSKLGIKENELSWFRNYLTAREQYVKIGNANSTKLEVKKGVPQGSILGPLLFLIYINDLAKSTNLFSLLFADDTTFLVSAKTLDEAIGILNIELKKICYWFRTNELNINSSKTKFMIFTRNESNINWDNIDVHLDYNNTGYNDENLIKKLDYVNTLSKTPAIKFLGVYIDPKLNFQFHIDHLQKKVSKSLYAIRSVKHILNAKSLCTLYNALIHPHFLYCNLVWSCTCDSNMKRLLLLQKKAIRIITNSCYNAHTTPLFKRLKVLPIFEQIKYSKLVFMYDYIQKNLPLSFQGLWIRNNERNSLNLRNANLFYIPRPKKESFKKFPLYNFQKLWNEISTNQELTSNQSRSKFCKNLKSHFFSNLSNICLRRDCSECNP